MSSQSFSDCDTRPDNIQAILDSLDRYNPETTKTFEDYVQDQCENKTYDIFANLALLKLYQFNTSLANEERITNILVKALTAFPSSDFALCLSLLPPHVLHNSSTTHSNPAAGDVPLNESVQKLNTLYNLLSAGEYAIFWDKYNGDDLFADLMSDITDFDEQIRLRIISAVASCYRTIQRNVLQEWLDLKAKNFEELMGVVGFKIDGTTIKVPSNADNQAKGVTIQEKPKFEEFSRVIKRAFEQPA